MKSSAPFFLELHVAKRLSCECKYCLVITDSDNINISMNFKGKGLKSGKRVVISSSEASENKVINKKLKKKMEKLENQKVSYES